MKIDDAFLSLSPPSSKTKPIFLLLKSLLAFKLIMCFYSDSFKYYSLRNAWNAYYIPLVIVLNLTTSVPFHFLCFPSHLKKGMCFMTIETKDIYSYISYMTGSYVFLIIKVTHAQTLRTKWDIRGFSPNSSLTKEETKTQRSKMTWVSLLKLTN